jgi:hypothetical protein
VSDLPAEENLSKRERQKQRREAKREAERAAAARARRQRTLTFLLVGVLVLGLVGLAIQRQFAQRGADRAAREAAAAQLDELGCTPAETRPNLGASHLDGTELVANPPEVLYPDRPATSGPHLGSVALTGVFDEPIDERLLVHNLEHGYVTFYYTDDADPADVEALRAFAQEQIDGRFPKIIAAPASWQLGDGQPIAFAAWDARQLCERFSEDIALTFLNDFHGLSGTAPERTVQAHTNPGQQGVLNPRDVEGPLLFPPLGESGPGDLDDAMDGDDEAGEPEGDPTEEATPEQ